jgi:undecaprenyl-diphosphatase
VFANPRSGDDGTAIEDLRRRFSGYPVEECQPGTLRDRIRSVIAEAPDFIGVAGGDGTVRSAVEELRTTSIPLLVIPTGTRNHFAHQLGIADLDAAQRAAATGTRHRVDLGRVNGCCFVNNSSIGAYTELVREREHHEGHLSKRVAAAIAAYRVLRHGKALHVTLDGTRRRVWLVFVGNGRYGNKPSDLIRRDSLTTSVLDIRVLRAEGRFTRCRIFVATVFGRLPQSRLIEQYTAQTACVAVHGPSIAVALDGDVETLESPLTYSSEPSKLTVLVPADSVEPTG